MLENLFSMNYKKNTLKYRHDEWPEDNGGTISREAKKKKERKNSTVKQNQK
jgi:hypothetical protein